MFRVRRTTESLGDRIFKVDHAGEHGAVNIRGLIGAVIRLAVRF